MRGLAFVLFFDIALVGQTLRKPPPTYSYQLETQFDWQPPVTVEVSRDHDWRLYEYSPLPFGIDTKPEPIRVWYNSHDQLFYIQRNDGCHTYRNGFTGTGWAFFDPLSDEDLVQQILKFNTKPRREEVINGQPARYFDNGITKAWLARDYDIPLRVSNGKVDHPRSEVRRLSLTASPASKFQIPAGCQAVNPADEAFGSTRETLNYMRPPPRPLRWPDAYSLRVKKKDGTIIQIDHDHDREAVRRTNQEVFFDFKAHRATVRDRGCRTTTLHVSKPFNHTDLEGFQEAAATRSYKVVRRELVNGVKTRLLLNTPLLVPQWYWIAEDYDFPVKSAEANLSTSKLDVIFEPLEVRFGPPLAARLDPPSGGCQEVMPEGIDEKYQQLDKFTAIPLPWETKPTPLTYTYKLTTQLEREDSFRDSITVKRDHDRLLLDWDVLSRGFNPTPTHKRVFFDLARHRMYVAGPEVCRTYAYEARPVPSVLDPIGAEWNLGNVKVLGRTIRNGMPARMIELQGDRLWLFDEYAFPIYVTSYSSDSKTSKMSTDVRDLHFEAPPANELVPPESCQAIDPQARPFGLFDATEIVPALREPPAPLRLPPPAYSIRARSIGGTASEIQIERDHDRELIVETGSGPVLFDFALHRVYVGRAPNCVEAGYLPDIAPGDVDPVTSYYIPFLADQRPVMVLRYEQWLGMRVRVVDQPASGGPFTSYYWLPENYDFPLRRGSLVEPPKPPTVDWEVTQIRYSAPPAALLQPPKGCRVLPVAVDKGWSNWYNIKTGKMPEQQ